MDFPITFCAGASDHWITLIDHLSNYCCDSQEYGLNYACWKCSGICSDLAGLHQIELDKMGKRHFVLEIAMRTKSLV